MHSPVAKRTELFTESVIREMSRLIMLYHPEHGINLAQGFPDFPAPQQIKDAACAAIQSDVNQYAITWGARALRSAIAAKALSFNGLQADPEREITVCCGATECMISSMVAVVNPGDEVIVLCPYYENYWPDVVLAGATPRFVSLHEPDWHLDPDELRQAFNARTKAIIINTPNNPTGKVFTRAELSLIAELCQEHDALAITDEIYEHIVYEGEHISLATLPGMADRTITISGLSKTFSVTGWRLGYVIACAEITNAIRKVHDFLTVGAPAPLQAAATVALGLGNDYYEQLLADYRERRDLILEILAQTGFEVNRPAGAYYVMADISRFGFDDDLKFAHHLIKEHAIAVVPGSSFFPEPAQGRTKVRFAFPKRLETLRGAGDRLLALRPAGALSGT